MHIICTCIYILANKETSNAPGIGIPTVTWKQNPVNQGDSQVDPECTKDPTLPPHSPLPQVFPATPCCTHSEPSCTATFGCAHPSMFPIAWRTFHHKPALVAPIILWLEYPLCAHHTNFPNSQLLGTCVDPHGPAFLPTWPFMACAPPCSPFCTPPRTSVHLCTPLHTFMHPSTHLCAPLRISAHPCTTFCAALSRASHPYWTFHLTSDPFSYPGQLSPSATGHNAHPWTSVESSPNSVAPIWPIHFSLWACTTHIAIQGPCPAGSSLPNQHLFSLCKFFASFGQSPKFS